MKNGASNRVSETLLSLIGNEEEERRPSRKKTY